MSGRQPWLTGPMRPWKPGLAGVLGHFLTSVVDVAFLTSVQETCPKKDMLIAAAPRGPAGGYPPSLTRGNRPPHVWVPGCSLICNIITHFSDMTKKSDFRFPTARRWWSGSGGWSTGRVSSETQSDGRKTRGRRPSGMVALAVTTAGMGRLHLRPVVPLIS